MEKRTSFLATKKFWVILSSIVLLTSALVIGISGLDKGEVQAATEQIALPVYQPQRQVAQQPEQAASTQTQTGADTENATLDDTTVLTNSLAHMQPAQTQQVQTQPAQNSAASYAGDVRAVNTVPVAVEVIGQVLQLNVGVGDQVQAGDVLLQIDSTTLEAQRAQALAGLQAAEAQLNGLLLDADAGDVAAAQAAVSAAAAAYDRTTAGPTAEDLEIAEAQMRQAQAAVKQAQAAYNEVKWMPNIGMMPQSLALEQATLQLEAAEAQYAKVTQGATQDAINGAYAQLASAQAQLDRLLKGANEPQLDAVRAQVRQAETALLLADIQVDKATVRAPIDGVVNQVNTATGANVAPGGPVFEILSDDVKVVINVEEFRRGDIYIGQPATITVNAYRNRTFAGAVVTIAPALDAATRTFAVTVQPTDDASALAPGMFATVELGN